METAQKPLADLRARWIASAQAPQDAAALYAFRVLFGGLMCASALRFVANGWVERFFARPTFFFKYDGFSWVTVLPPNGMVALFLVMAAAALCVALGFYYRVAAFTFFFAFTYVELIDVTNYLNHYYLVSVLAFLCCLLPLHRGWSLDARSGRVEKSDVLPAWMTWVFRFQIACVYTHAALAKCTADWLLHGQPLGVWTASRAELPIVSWVARTPWAVLAMSWAGFLHDLLIAPLLLLPRVRGLAYAALVTFHLATAFLFTIGMFPFIMILSATVFLAPGWPRRFVDARDLSEELPAVRTRAWVPLLLTFCLFQALFPLRAHLYPGHWLWHEQGMRFSWRVLCREKNGSVSYRARYAGRDHERLISANQYLSDHQEREMAGQPDLIVQLAEHIAAELRAEGHEDVSVRADAFVSLNGRPAARLLDRDRDLLQVPSPLFDSSWILPAPTSSPAPLVARP